MTQLDVGRDSIPPAGVVGRAGKLLVGVLQLWGCFSVWQHFSYLQQGSWQVGLWLFVISALWLLKFVINLGFRRVLNLGYRPLWAALAVLAVLAGVEYYRVGSVWGIAVTTALLALTMYVHLHLGLSHVFAAITGIDGCEMRVIPYYLSRWFGDGRIALHRCPGMWTPLDRWEARLRGQEAFEG